MSTEPSSETKRHLNRSSIGVGIGVIIMLLIVGIDNIATIGATLVLGVIGGAYIGSLADIRGHAADALRWTLTHIDTPKDKDESDAQ